MSRITYPQLVVPENYQVSHFERVDKIIEEEGFYCDPSQPGLGKTYPPLFQCQKRGLSLFVVAPLSVVDRWISVCAEYGVVLKCVVSYDSLRSTKNKQPKHQYLERIDNVLNAGSESVEFKATDKLKKLIAEGCVFVLDECHKLKNRSAQWKACKEITREILESKSESSFSLLSGSFFDKIEHARQALELMGILKSRFMYRTNPHTGLLDYMRFGLGEVIDKAKKYDTEETNKILNEHHISTINSKKMESVSEKVCYELLTKVILKHVGSVMTNDKIRNLKNGKFIKESNGKRCKLIPDIMNIIANYLLVEDKKNGYFKVSPENEKLISDKVAEYARAIGFNPDNDDVDLKRLGKGVQISQQLEALKIADIFERVTREKLTANPKAKMVIFLNYIDNIEDLFRRLKEFNPIIFYGATKNRGKWIEKFMKDPTARVFIANLTVGGIGIELDDQIGDEDRYVLMSPSFRVIEMYQGLQRVFRKNTKSNVWARIVYADIRLGKHQIKESRILNAITKKSGVLKSIPGGELQKYTGEFEDEYEIGR
jgi:hypothetical protein